MNTDHLTPEEILALEEKVAQQSNASSASGTDVGTIVSEAADVALEVLTDVVTGTGDVLCGVASVAGDVVCGVGEGIGAILGAFLD